MHILDNTYISKRHAGPSLELGNLGQAKSRPPMVLLEELGDMGDEFG